MNKLPIFVTIPVRSNVLNDKESHDKDFLISDIKSYMDKNIIFKDKTEIRTTLDRVEISKLIKETFINFYTQLK